MAFNNRNNLSNESAPWGREVEQKIESNTYDLNQLSLLTENNNKAAGGALRLLTSQQGYLLPITETLDRQQRTTFVIELPYEPLNSPYVGTLANNWQGMIYTFSLGSYFNRETPRPKDMVPFARIHLRGTVGAVFNYSSPSFDPVLSQVGINVGTTLGQTTAPDNFTSHDIVWNNVVFTRSSSGTTYTSGNVDIRGTSVVRLYSEAPEISFRPISRIPTNQTADTCVFDGFGNYTHIRGIIEVFWVNSYNVPI